jgi:hypothetical protein
MEPWTLIGWAIIGGIWGIGLVCAWEWWKESMGLGGVVMAQGALLVLGAVVFFMVFGTETLGISATIAKYGYKAISILGVLVLMGGGLMVFFGKGFDR